MSFTQFWGNCFCCNGTLLTWYMLAGHVCDQLEKSFLFVQRHPWAVYEWGMDDFQGRRHILNLGTLCGRRPWNTLLGSHPRFCGEFRTAMLTYLWDIVVRSGVSFLIAFRSKACVRSRFLIVCVCFLVACGRLFTWIKRNFSSPEIQKVIHFQKWLASVNIHAQSWCWWRLWC